MTATCTRGSGVGGEYESGQLSGYIVGDVMTCADFNCSVTMPTRDWLGGICFVRHCAEHVLSQELCPVTSCSIMPGMRRIIDDRRAPAWHRLKAFFLLMQGDYDIDAEATNVEAAQASIERRQHWFECAAREIQRCREEYMGEQEDETSINLVEGFVNCEKIQLEKEKEAMKARMTEGER